MGNNTNKDSQNIYNVDLVKRHRPNPQIYRQFSEKQINIPCNINHVCQLYNQKQYKPSQFYIDAFYQIIVGHVYYRGQWKNGLPDGFGEIIHNGISYFRGYIVDLKAKGEDCLLAMKDKSCYIGGFSKNKRSGKGVFIDKDYKVEGQWYENLPHGIVKEYFQNGDNFEGRFVKGKKNGRGIYTWANGPYARYQGIFKDNMIDQKGVLITRQGIILDGNFDCSNDFTIKFCTIKNDTFQLANCLIKEGSLQNFDYKNNKYMKHNEKDKVYHHRNLIYCSKDYSEETIQIICKIIQQNYQFANKHSEAMKSIRSALRDFDCNWWSEEDERKGIIAEICGKKIKVCKN